MEQPRRIRLPEICRADIWETALRRCRKIRLHSFHLPHNVSFNCQRIALRNFSVRCSSFFVSWPSVADPFPLWSLGHILVLLLFAAAFFLPKDIRSYSLKLYINEQGDVYILNGKDPEIKGKLENFPPKDYWNALTDIFISDNMTATQTEQALELSCM